MIWSTVLGDIGRIHIQVESNTETCSQNKTFQDKSFHCPRYRYGTWGTNGHTKLANTIKYVRIHWILLNHIRPSSRQTIICHKWNKVMCWVVSHPSTIGLGQVMILHCSAGRTHTHTHTDAWNMITHIHSDTNFVKPNMGFHIGKLHMIKLINFPNFPFF